jgi:hypothetical protein
MKKILATLLFLCVFATPAGAQYYQDVAVITGKGQPSAPVNVTPPVASGDVIMGYTVSCTTGTWSAYPAPTYTYQWRKNGSNITGATSSTYVVDSANASGPIDCVVTATNTAGSASADSNDLTTWGPLNLVSAGYTIGEFLDATVASSITDAGGGAVSQWNDLGSLGNNATQGTNANRPITGTRTINSGNALDCDGTNDNFTVSTTTISTGANSIFTIFLPDNATTGTTDIFSSDGNSGTGNRTKSGNQYADFDSSTMTRVSPTSGSAIVQLACVNGNGSGRTQTLKVNNDTTITGTVTRNATAAAAVRVCSNGNNTNYFNGAIQVVLNLRGSSICADTTNANKLLAWGAWRAGTTPGTLP